LCNAKKYLINTRIDGLWIMPKIRSSQSILAQAKEKEKKYDWLRAAESYDEAQACILKRKIS